MIVNLKVFRYDPEKMKKPRYDIFTVEGDPTDRVLDLLEYVRGDVDGTLAFRRSCAHGVCGSDAMRINGRNYLACKVLVRDLKPGPITIEPLLGLRVIKDLIVDMEPFFDHYRKIMPYLVNDTRLVKTKSACKHLPSAPVSTIPPSVSCAPPAPLPARLSGPISSMSARPLW
jgi:succinate dehydrogenase / fumarate reductase, iron-sulfur subunit